MSSELGVAYLSIAAETRGFARDTKRALGDFESQSTRSGKRSGFSIGGGLKRGIGLGVKALGGLTLGVAALAAKGGITRALAIEGAEAKLRGLGHSTASISKIMANALASVKGTAYGLGDAAKVAATLSASGVKSGKQLEGVLKTVADVASISGRSMTDIGTIFASVAARGKLQGDDMLQLMSSGVPVLQLVAKQLGITSAEASKLVSQGKVDFATFAAAMKDGMGGAALESGKTFTGALANMNAAFGRLGAVVATPALASLKTVFNAVTPAVDGLTAKLGPLMDKLGPKMEQATKAGVKNLAPMFASVAGAVKAALPQVQGVFETLTKGIDFGSLASSVGQVISAVSPLGLVFKSLAPLLPQIGQAFATLANQGLAILVPLLAQIAPMFAQVGATLVQAGAQIAAALLPVLMQLATAILPVIGQVIAAVVPVVLQLVQAFLPLVGVVANLVTALLPPLASLITGLLSAVMPLVTAVLGFVQALMPLVGIVTQLISSLIPPLVAVLNALIPPIVEVVAQLAGALAPILQAVGNLISALMPIISGLVGVIGTIVGAVAPVVAIIAGALIGVLAKLIGIVGQVIAAIVNFVASGIQAFTRWASGIGSKVGEVVTFFTQLPGKIVGALAGLAGQMLSVGRNIIQGLINGVVGAASGVISAIVNTVTGAISAAKRALGIASPSKVFRKLGQFVSLGLAVGITDSASKASSAIGKVITAITDQANRAGKKQLKAAKATAEAAKKILKHQQSVVGRWWKTEGLASKTTDKFLASLTKGGAWTKKASASLRRATLADFGAARDVMADRLKSANDKLKSLMKERNQLRDQVSDSLMGALDLEGALSSTTYTKHSDAKGNTWYTQSKAGFSGIAAHVKTLAAKAKRFAAQLKRLIAAGFPAALVQEVAGLGIEGGISVAAALLGASKSERASLISDFKSLQSATKSAGAYVADQMFGAGINAQKGLIAGLLADDKKLAAAAKRLVSRLTKAVKKELGIKSPSTVFRDEVGLMVAAGTAEGIEKGQPLISRAASGMVDPSMLDGSFSSSSAATVYAFPGLTLSRESMTEQQRWALDMVTDMLTHGSRLAKVGA